MSVDPIHYSEVLADLKARRDALTNRTTNIDPAIDSIHGLLDGGSVQATPAEPAYFAPTSVPKTGMVAAAQPVPINSNEPERRKRSIALNVYVNPFPEWGRAMAQGKTVARKKAGVRCPKCGSCDTRQSLTRGLSDFFLFLFDFMNARCRNCSARFRIWQTPEAQSLLAEAVPETE